VSLVIAKAANAGLGLASIMFPGVPQIPGQVLEAGDKVVSLLGAKSSAQDFACIQESLDQAAPGDATAKQQVGPACSSNGW
jgi:hypothetical protein